MFVHMTSDIVTNLGFDVEAAGGRKEIHSEFCGETTSSYLRKMVFLCLREEGRTDSWSYPKCGLWHGYCGILEVYHGSGGYLVTWFAFCDCDQLCDN